MGVYWLFSGKWVIGLARAQYRSWTGREIMVMVKSHECCTNGLPNRPTV